MQPNETPQDQVVIENEEKQIENTTNNQLNDAPQLDDQQNIVSQFEEPKFENISINVQLNDDQIYANNSNDNQLSQEQILENDVRILRSEIHSKTEYLKKIQNENKSLRKKYNELLNIMKSKETQMKRDFRQKGYEDSIKWQAVWETVITQITHVIPYTLPKDLNSEQQRNILVDITKQLCAFSVRSNETLEHKKLKEKYEKTQRKLKQLKDQCSSLLEIIQNQQHLAEKSHKPTMNDIYLSNTNTSSKYRFNTIHDDICAFSKGYPYSNTRQNELCKFTDYNEFGNSSDDDSTDFSFPCHHSYRMKHSNYKTSHSEYRKTKGNREIGLQDDFDDFNQCPFKASQERKKLDLSNLIIVENIENDSKSLLFEQI